jgi:DNA-binding NarL/FixJ family response regulator
MGTRTTANGKAGASRWLHSSRVLVFRNALCRSWDRSGAYSVKVLIDDHPIVMAGCKLLMAGEQDVELIGAADGNTAVALYEREKPDVTVLDLQIPGSSPTTLMRQLLTSDPKARILVFTMNDDPLLAAQMVEQGAKGFVSKCEDPACIVTAIREVASYRYYISPLLPRGSRRCASIRPSK